LHIGNFRAVVGKLVFHKADAPGVVRFKKPWGKSRFVAKSHKGLYPAFRGLFLPDGGVDLLHEVLKMLRFGQFGPELFQSVGIIAGNTAAPIIKIMLLPVAVHGFSPLSFCLSLRGTFSTERRGHSLVYDAPAPPEKMDIPVGPWPYRPVLHPQDAAVPGKFFFSGFASVTERILRAMARKMRFTRTLE
jgi:hypothetical protein